MSRREASASRDCVVGHKRQKNWRGMEDQLCADSPWSQTNSGRWKPQTAACNYAAGLIAISAVLPPRDTPRSRRRAARSRRAFGFWQRQAGVRASRVESAACWRRTSRIRHLSSATGRGRALPVIFKSRIADLRHLGCTADAAGAGRFSLVYRNFYELRPRYMAPTRLKRGE